MVSEVSELTIAGLMYSGLEPPNPVVTESKITIHKVSDSHQPGATSVKSTFDTTHSLREEVLNHSDF